MGEPNCQNTKFPLPVTVMLLQEPSRVTVFVCPLISASLPLQIKIKVWLFPVTTIGSVFVGVGVTVGGMDVGGITVGGMSVGSGFVGTGVDVSAGGCVLVGSGVGVLDGYCVIVGNGVGVSDGVGVFVGMETAVPVGSPVAVGVKAIPGRSSWDVLVGCAASTGGSIIKTLTSSMAAPAFSNVILTNRAWTGENRVFMVSVCETLPLKPVCSERKTCAYST